MPSFIQVKRIESLSIEDSILDSEFVFDYDEIFKFKEIIDIGSFYGYKNRAIKVNFVDRTILKIDSKFKKIAVTDKFGQNFIFNEESFLKNSNQFKKYFMTNNKSYLDYSLQFYDWCYLSNQRKNKIQENMNNLNQISLQEISKNTIFTNITNPSKLLNKNIPSLQINIEE